MSERDVFGQLQDRVAALEIGSDEKASLIADIDELGTSYGVLLDRFMESSALNRLPCVDCFKRGIQGMEEAAKIAADFRLTSRHPCGASMGAGWNDAAARIAIAIRAKATEQTKALKVLDSHETMIVNVPEGDER